MAFSPGSVYNEGIIPKKIQSRNITVVPNRHGISPLRKTAWLFLIFLWAAACLPGGWISPVLDPSPTPKNQEPPDQFLLPQTPLPSPTVSDIAWQASPAAPFKWSEYRNEDSQEQAAKQQGIATATAVPAVPLPTPTWIYNASGEAEVPILMYHHVSNDPAVLSYGIQIHKFRQQMEFLKREGFTTLTVVELAAVLRDGGLLPPRPVVITFDDGNFDVYQNAFPILQEMAFKATMYMVSNRVNAEGFLSAEMLKELASAGWEIGSHSATHANLVGNPDLLRDEIYQSKVSLEKVMGGPIKTFAYPFASADSEVFYKVSKYGYQAAVCVSPSNHQGVYNLYCLNRREVKDDFSLARFQELLGLSQ
jgi:peptidoglycan/xylan/chitin deacetylase (PgdA/CDA1 family)